MARRGRKPNSTKATTNSKSVKETKTMAKATSTKKTTTKATVNAKVKETKDMKNTMTLSAEEMEMIKEMREKKAAGKTAEKKTATKVATKAKATKTENKEFNSDLYYSIAEALGVNGKNGVYKVARPVVYGLMKLDKIKKSDITKAKEQIVTIATEQNLTWLLEKLGVEAEEEAEDVDVDFEDIAQ